MIDLSNSSQKIFYGRGVKDSQLLEIKEKTLLILTSLEGRKRFISQEFSGKLALSNKLIFFDKVNPNPDKNLLEKFFQLEIDLSCVDYILSFGGGSVIDFGKIISVLGLNNIYESINDFNFDGHVNDQNILSIKHIAIPTTAGTGSEATSFATLWDKNKNKKYSISSKLMLPEIVLIDPSLTDSLPRETTLSTALDSLSHSFESIWNKNSDYKSKGYALKGATLTLLALEDIVKNKSNNSVRNQLLLGSFYAGRAINISKTAVCHSISYPLTLHYGVEHGFAAAFTLIEVLKLSIEKNHKSFKKIANNIGINGNSWRDTFINRIESLFYNLNFKYIYLEKIINLDNLFKVFNEMNTPSRLKNFNVSIDDNTLEELITISWNKINDK